MQRRLAFSAVGRVSRIEAPARAYLLVIERNPKTVQKALRSA